MPGLVPGKYQGDRYNGGGGGGGRQSNKFSPHTAGLQQLR